MNETSLSANFLRKIIHDMNGELFLIRGYAEMAVNKSGSHASASVRNDIEKILERAEILEKLIEQLRSKEKSMKD